MLCCTRLWRQAKCQACPGPDLIGLRRMSHSKKQKKKKKRKRAGEDADGGRAGTAGGGGAEAGGGNEEEEPLLEVGGWARWTHTRTEKLARFPLFISLCLCIYVCHHVFVRTGPL